MTRDGYKKNIDEFSDFKTNTLKVFDMNDHVEDSAKIATYMGLPPKFNIVELKTATGNKIIASLEHPFLTPKGMKKIGHLKKGNKVAVYPFEGVPYEKPSKKLIIKKMDVNKTVAAELIKRDLLPMTLTHPKIGALARIVGYILGDGYIYRVKEKRKDRKKIRDRLIIGASGEKEGLEDLRKDIIELGFKPSRVYSRSRQINGQNHYGKFTTKSKENFIRVTAGSFSILINKLGVPIGKKIEIHIPEWIMSSPLWIKRNFLAGLFGAELSKPREIKNHPYTLAQLFYTIGCPKNKKRTAVKFLEDIEFLLKEFGVQTGKIYEIPGTKRSVGFRFPVSGRDENLIKILSQIGYEYNKERQFLGAMACHYLKLKRNHKSELKNRYKKISFPTFRKFLNDTINSDLRKTGMVYEQIKELKKTNYNGLVYDFTVNHKDHNFIANNFTVSNCGMRMLTTNLTWKDVKPKLKQVIDEFFRSVPSGVGGKGFVKINHNQFDDLMINGSKWCVENGYGLEEDVQHTEDYGALKGADPAAVSDKAKKRGITQVGTLGSGNHFLELQVVHGDNIFDKEIAKVFGITGPDQVTLMIHCGSRGLGHQVGTDYVRLFSTAVKKYKIDVPDPELSSAPFSSREGQDYYKAMACAANMAFANRQVIMHRVREAFGKVFGKDAELNLVYDVAHNIAKIEEYEIDGKRKSVLVHRKGATRSFGPGHPELPDVYKKTGQPVIIGGSMETGSYALVGTKKAEQETFGSTCHGAGRTMSRSQAKRQIRGDQLQKDMLKRGIYVKTASFSGLAEEAGAAYKNISDVISAVHDAGISQKVVGLVPVGNVKG